MTNQVSQEIIAEKWASYLKVVLLVVAVLALGFGGKYGLDSYRQSQNEKAFGLLFQADTLEDLASKEGSATQKSALEVITQQWGPDKAKDYLSALNKVSQSFPNSAAADIAQLRLARFYVASGQIPEAQKIWETLGQARRSGERLIFKAMALEALGVSYEDAQKFDVALNYWNQAIELKTNPLLAQAEFGRARALLAMGKKPEAKESLDRVVKNFPDTAFEKKARAMLGVEGL